MMQTVSTCMNNAAVAALRRAHDRQPQEQNDKIRSMHPSIHTCIHTHPMHMSVCTYNDIMYASCIYLYIHIIDIDIDIDIDRRARDSRRPLFPCGSLQSSFCSSHLTRGPYRLHTSSALTKPSYCFFITILPNYLLLNTAEYLRCPWLLATFLKL